MRVESSNAIDFDNLWGYLASMKMATRPHLYSFPLEDLRAWLQSKGLARFGADQIYNWVYKNWELDPLLWTNVAKKTKEALLAEFELAPPKIVWQGLSSDGTRKFLVRMHDGKTVETVAIAAEDRLTLCISSQVGCAIGCTFCHTGTMGLTRNLQAGEIVGQFVAVTKWLQDNVDANARLSNIVYMGQGEPLHNFDEVKKSATIFLEEKGIGLSQRKVTLSTSGLVPQIKKLWDFPPINIAISLHAAHNDVRTELMPINKAFDLERLFDAIRTIPLKARRRITYEYILIAGLNDREEDIEGLMRLLDVETSKVNIIPFNEYPESRFKRPTDTHIRWFQKRLLDNGYTCTVRVTKGHDILAACGQLKSKEDALNLWQ